MHHRGHVTRTAYSLRHYPIINDITTQIRYFRFCRPSDVPCVLFYCKYLRWVTIWGTSWDGGGRFPTPFSKLRFRQYGSFVGIDLALSQIWGCDYHDWRWLMWVTSSLGSERGVEKTTIALAAMYLVAVFCCLFSSACLIKKFTWN